MPKVQTIPSAAPTRASRLRRVNVSLAEINVVPLVDVMLVLLIIFMVTAPMIQRGIDVNLPVAQRAQAISGERIEVIVPAEYRQNHIVYLGSDPIRKELLQERVRHGEVVEVTDLLKAAGVEHVGLVTKSPNER